TSKPHYTTSTLHTPLHHLHTPPHTSIIICSVWTALSGAQSKPTTPPPHSHTPALTANHPSSLRLICGELHVFSKPLSLSLSLSLARSLCLSLLPYPFL